MKYSFGKHLCHVGRGRNLKHPETKAIRQNCDAFDNKIKVFCPMKNMSDNRKYLQCLRDKELVSKYRGTLVKINLTGKWSKNMVRPFTEGETKSQQANKQMLKFIPSKRNTIKIKMRYSLTLISLAKWKPGQCYMLLSCTSGERPGERSGSA